MTLLLAFLVLSVSAPALAQERLIGLLEIPSLHGEMNKGNPEAPTTPLPLLAEPTGTAAAIAVAQSWRQVEYSEHDYEQVSANVYERRYASSGGLWYKLRFTREGISRYGWVQHVKDMQYREVHSLVKSKMAYLTVAWDRRLRETPNLDSPSTELDLKDDPPSARIIEIYNPRGDSEFWYLIAIISNPCLDGAPEILATGWVPAYAKEGGTNMWYFSRGC